MREVVVRWYVFVSAVLTAVAWGGVGSIPNLHGWFWGPAAGILVLALAVLILFVLDNKRKGPALAK